MKFRMRADLTFEAADIDDAFEKLRDHFDHLLQFGAAAPVLFDAGEVEIAPAENTKVSSTEMGT